MYSAARSPPRWPVPRPSSRSLERKRTCARMRSGSMDFMAAAAAAGSAGADAFGAAAGLAAFSCAAAPTVKKSARDALNNLRMQSLSKKEMEVQSTILREEVGLTNLRTMPEPGERHPLARGHGRAPF